MLNRTYDPANWYWCVGGSTTQVWSSADIAYVALSDAGYAAWAAAGNTPTNIATASALAEVLIQQWLPASLDSGVALVSTGTPALNGNYAADASSIGQAAVIAADIANGDGLPGGGSTFIYVDALGTHGPFDQTHFLAAYKGLKNYVYSLGQAVIELATGVSATLPTLPVTIA